MQTITKVYDDYERAERAVVELEAAGIPSSQISLLANRRVSKKYDDEHATSNATAGAGAGAVIGGGAGLLAGLGLLAVPGVGPILAAGALASTAAGVLAGGAAGGFIGALVDAGVSEEHAHVYSEALRRGATMLSVKADGAEVATAETILDQYQPLDPAALGADYRKTGWKSYDPDAPPYELSDLDLERIRRPL